MYRYENRPSPSIGHNQPEWSQDDLRCSDIGNAEVFADQHNDKLRYCFELSQWFFWDETVWKPGAEANLQELAEETVRSFPGEASELMDSQNRETFLKWAIRSGNRSRMISLLDHRLWQSSRSRWQTGNQEQSSPN